MVSTGVNYTKLKTHLRLAINRLKLCEKKKTELAQKARKEIAEYIAVGKFERAKIRVETIIREDYLVEAMEIVEMYCDLLLARFGMIQQLKTLDEGIAEAVSSVIWVSPRLQSDIQELKTISDLLSYKYGKQYAQASRENALKTVSEKLIHKLSIQAPPKILVEKYLIEIAKSHNLSYEPDGDVMKSEEFCCAEEAKKLIDFGDDQRGAAGGGFPWQYPGPHPPLPCMPPNGPYGEASGYQHPIGFNVVNPPAQNPVPVNYAAKFPDDPTNGMPEVYSGPQSGPPPNYDSIMSPPPDGKPRPLPRRNVVDSLPDLPDVPSNSPDQFDERDTSKDDIDFDDLAKRFDALKNKK